MKQTSRNIYRIGRDLAGMTQERWAEAIGCSVESVRLYETGRSLPPDELVITMVEVSGHHALGYWHLLQRSRMAAKLLPETQDIPLPQAALQLLVAINEFATMHSDLMRVAADGRITADEELEWEGITRRLDGVVKAALQLKFSEGGTT